MAKVIAKSANSVVSIEDDLKQSVALIGTSLAAIQAAAKHVAQCCARHAGYLDALCERIKGQVARQFIVNLERVGRGCMDPRLMMGLKNAIYANRLPLEAQRKVIDEGVECVVSDDGKQVEVLRLEQMDPYVAARALNNGTIADIQTQRNAIRSQAEAQKRVTADPEKMTSESIKRMHISINKPKREVTFTRPTTVKALQLQMLVAELNR